MGNIGSGTGSGYPTALDYQSSPEVNYPSAGMTKARAEVANDLASAVIATQTALGTNPQGTKSDVKTYLQTEHTTAGVHNDVSTSAHGFCPQAPNDATKFLCGDATWATPSVTTVSDVTASRAVNTVYQNTTGKTMYVRISVRGNSSTQVAIAYVGATSSPATVVSRAQVFINAVADITGNLNFEVLPNYYYKIIDGTYYIDAWIESY